MKSVSWSILKLLLFVMFVIFMGPIIVKFISGNMESEELRLMHAHGATRKHKMNQSARDSAKKDWHDHEAIEQDSRRTGLGEQGKALNITIDDAVKKERLYKENGYNAYLSEKIALDRSIPDTRHRQCKEKRYLAHLPTVSVVIPVYNEHFTTLLRSIQSVLNRSPPELIKEIILVDDFSTAADMKQRLNDHLKTHYDHKVWVLHLAKREGLIRARIAGARVAKGEVLLFLDSHIEANINWLPPLLEPIAENYRRVVCPIIDVIGREHFEYRSQDEGARGAFDWLLFYKRLPLLPEDLKRPTEPYKSPVMAGGLFAISAKWFWELGGYDPGLEVWGGEQYELSFKIWMCGGVMVEAPCSRLGHVYRKFNPHALAEKENYTLRNYKRVAEVWLDEYKDVLYARNTNYHSVEPGDILEQVKLRNTLQCKSFHWFITEVAFDLLKHYPIIEPPNAAEGEIRSMARADLCIDTMFRTDMQRFGLEKCMSGNKEISGEQSMKLTRFCDIRPSNRDYCFDVSQIDPSDRSPVFLFDCHKLLGNQWWKINVDTYQLYHELTKKCLDCDVEKKEIFISSCNNMSLTQKWIWGKLNETVARQMYLQE